MSGRSLAGTVYLLHFSAPYEHARHYTGWASGGGRGLLRRLRQHGTSEGARLLAVVAAAGITWELARTWEGTRADERRLKRQGGASRRCPLCGVSPRPAPLPLNADGSVSRARVPDWQRPGAGMMTAAEQAEHTALRRGAARGRVAGVVRLPSVPADDPWYVPSLGGAA